MDMIVDSQIVFLATKDLHATAEFYEQTLGLSLALDQGKCRIYKVAEQAFLGFCEQEEISASEFVSPQYI